MVKEKGVDNKTLNKYAYYSINMPTNSSVF